MTTAAETAPAAAIETVAYHWVITLQGDAAGGVATQTLDGAANLPSGYRRSGAYRDIVREAHRLIRELPGNMFTGDPACVLFFSLERDEL